MVPGWRVVVVLYAFKNIDILASRNFLCLKFIQIQPLLFQMPLGATSGTYVGKETFTNILL